MYFFEHNDISLYRFTHSMWNLEIDVFQRLFFKDIDQIVSLWLKGIEDNHKNTFEIQTFNPIGRTFFYQLQRVALIALAKKLNSIWDITDYDIESVGKKVRIG